MNNAAIAAQALRQAGAGRVAVVDIDAHHGNGTQAIFYHRPDVYYGSVHVDPGAGWFPHYVGFADERGSGAGTDANQNLPLAPGTGDENWLAAVRAICAHNVASGWDCGKCRTMRRTERTTCTPIVISACRRRETCAPRRAVRSACSCNS